jgi:hypothetical protein
MASLDRSNLANNCCAHIQGLVDPQRCAFVYLVFVVCICVFGVRSVFAEPRVRKLCCIIVLWRTKRQRGPPSLMPFCMLDD